MMKSIIRYRQALWLTTIEIWTSELCGITASYKISYRQSNIKFLLDLVSLVAMMWSWELDDALFSMSLFGSAIFYLRGGSQLAIMNWGWNVHLEGQHLPALQLQRQMSRIFSTWLVILVNLPARMSIRLLAELWLTEQFQRPLIGKLHWANKPGKVCLPFTDIQTGHLGVPSLFDLHVTSLFSEKRQTSDIIIIWQHSSYISKGNQLVYYLLITSSLWA